MLHFLFLFNLPVVLKHICMHNRNNYIFHQSHGFFVYVLFSLFFQALWPHRQFPRKKYNYQLNELILHPHFPTSPYLPQRGPPLLILGDWEIHLRVTEQSSSIQ